MISQRTEILALLLTFRHGHHTNIAKGVMNNRDACALILWKLGPMKKSHIISLLNDWREPKFNKWTGTHVDRAQTYLFNSSRSGGYGCVADHPMQRGNHMSNVGWSGIVSDKRGEPGMKTFFRRTYWYRLTKGTYAPTVECAKRMTELGFHS